MKYHNAYIGLDSRKIMLLKRVPKDWPKLILAIAICQAAGVVGAIFTSPSIGTWYTSLVKPSFVPPNWLFTPVWLTLYTLMGISLFLVIRKKATRDRFQAAIMTFNAQLILNVVWSYMFFGLRAISAGLVTIIALWAAITLTISAFSHISKTASKLLIPYLAWVSIALVLNYYLWLLNA